MASITGEGMTSKRELKITLDHLPYPELNPNSRVHWAVKARAVKASREEVGWLAKHYWKDKEPMVKARISYEFMVKDRRKRDIDNLVAACKPFADGLIDAGVIFYDDSQHLEYGVSSVTTDDKNETIIRVVEL